MSAFTEVAAGVHRFADTCNVYVVLPEPGETGGGAVAIDFGSGDVLDHLDELGLTTLDAVLMTHQEPGPRVRVSLLPAQTATIEDVSGAALHLTCGAGAAEMIIERKPAELDSVSAR